MIEAQGAISPSETRPFEPFLTAREVAGRLRISPSTVLRYHREGRLPGMQLPGGLGPVRFRWSEIERAFSGEWRATA